MTSSPYHIDLTKIPEPYTETFYLLPEEKQDRISTALLFVGEATATRAGKPLISRAPCMKSIKQYLECRGQIELIRNELSGTIGWECSKCGDHGSITGYEENKWDLSDVPEKHAQQYLFDIYDRNHEEIHILHELGIPYDIHDPEENEELFNWLDSLPEDEKGKMAEMIGEKLNELEEKIEGSVDDVDPMKTWALLTTDWDTPESLLQFSETMEIDDVGNTFVYRHTQQFLMKLAKEGAFELTPSGYLKRSHVTTLLDNGHWPDEYIEELHATSKVLNEADVWPLHMMRILLQHAGLVRKQNNRLVPVKKQTWLTGRVHAGQLYKRLFMSCFRTTSLGYIADTAGLDRLQAEAATIFYRLHLKADGWMNLEDLPRLLLSQDQRLDLLKSLVTEYDDPDRKFYRFLLWPLKLFGLLETRQENGPDRLSGTHGQIRKSPLFDRFIEFRF